MNKAVALGSFNDFLGLARTQAESQQLLFVFTRTELPERPTPDQVAEFGAGEGGCLEPVACVDMAPHDIADFAAFAHEADMHVNDWAVVFAAALPGIANRPPTLVAIDTALEQMVETVRSGQIATYIAFDRQGVPLRLTMTH